MTEDEILALHKRALRSAYYYCKNKEDAEDIASEVVEYVLLKDLKNFRVKFLVIDMLRKRYGRKEDIHVEAKRNVYRAYDVHDDNLVNVADDEPNALETMQSREDYERAREYLQPIQRCIVTLFVQYGLSFKEIADCFGYTDSWVSFMSKKTGHQLERVKILSRKRT